MENTSLGLGVDEEREITAPLDARSLQEGWARIEAGAPRMHVRLTLGAKTDLGRVRDNNEDKFDFLEPEDSRILALRGRLYAVADGMGGHAAGQIASELGLKTAIRRYFANTCDEAEAALVAAIQYANGFVFDTAGAIPGRSGMGTTLTTLVIREDQFLAAQVGDSRLYRIRDGRAEQITRDHSWVAEQVASGALDAAEAARSPFRNVITRSLGATKDVKVDTFGGPVQPGDVFLLCSDGLTGQVPDEAIAAIASSSPPSVACMELIEAANDSGGRDNITVLIVRVDAVAPYAAMAPAPPAKGEEQPPEDPLTQAPERAETRGLFGLFGRR